MKKASRGVGKGKWNAPGGKVENGESPRKNAKREVLEETNLKVKALMSHGTILFFMNGSRVLEAKVHVFSTRDFTGTPQSTDEGRVRWFGLAELPFDGMWDDAKYWLGLMLGGSKFDARFYYTRGDRAVKSFKITPR